MALKNKNNRINDLVLLVPQNKRDIGKEQQIIKNLKNYFSAQLFSLSENFKKNLQKGIFLFLIALLLMIFNAVIGFELHSNLLASIIRIVLEPSGWFLVWIAFDILYYDLRKIQKDKLFFRELTAIQIIFQSSDSYIMNE